MAYFRLFRVFNLMIIALIMFFFKFFLFDVALAFDGVESPLSNWQFIWMVATYVVLTAGGYAINDYYDIGMDEINKPDKTVLRNKIPLSAGQNWFFILTAVGLISGCGLAWVLNTTTLYFVPVFVAALYWFYSTKYKRELLAGNITVAILAALNILIVYIYFILTFHRIQDFPVSMFSFINKVVFIYAMFAFLVTFIREVIKDIPDVEGDKEFDCDNLPIRYGIKNTKTILLILSALFLLILGYFGYYSIGLKKMYLMYYIFIILIPFWIYFMRGLYKANEKKDFTDLATLLKLYMLAGIFSLQMFDITNAWR